MKKILIAFYLLCCMVCTDGERRDLRDLLRGRDLSQVQASGWLRNVLRYIEEKPSKTKDILNLLDKNEKDDLVLTIFKDFPDVKTDEFLKKFIQLESLSILISNDYEF